jgi:alanine-synthesizing transaminase
LPLTNHPGQDQHSLRLSRRVPPSLAVNQLTTAVERLRPDGGPLIDLTVTNPTKVGLEYPRGLLDRLSDPRALTYDPRPFGLLEARSAVAAEYARAGAIVSPDNVVLTASTSEAYSILFKLFCDPHDNVLVPAPSYPLFEHLARLDAIDVRPYPLEYHSVWSIDDDGLADAIDERTRAVIVVSPNNPTGSFLRRRDWTALCERCAARGLPVIVDEVFTDYRLDIAPDAVRSVLEHTPAAGVPLVMSLGGLSKSIGLPQAKLAWLALHGTGRDKGSVHDALEVICDSYLSVSTPVQVALPALLREGCHVRQAIVERIRWNLEALKRRVAATPSCTLLRVEGGWSAVVRLPRVRDEETLVLDLLTRDRVLVHPGYFFDFPSEVFVVLSLLAAPKVFEEGVDRLCRRADA